MIENLFTMLSIAFIATTILTLCISYWIISNSDEIGTKERAGIITLAMAAWLVLQAGLALSNTFSQDTDSIPPKIFLFGILPNILFIVWVLCSSTGQNVIDRLPLDKLTYLNLVRIPVEFVLYWMFLQGLIPEIMTFDGLNFDIIMGISAPLIIFYGFFKPIISRKTILLWNIIGVIFLIFIFIIALLSAPSPLQRIAFDQPNIGLLLFPFNWLPSFIVPIVILGHLISIRQIIQGKTTN